MQQNSIAAESAAVRTREEIKNDAGYQSWISSIRRRFTEVIAEHGALYTTSVLGDDLWQKYLALIDEPLRSENVCYACRSFVRKYGGLVCIAKNGKLVSPIWYPSAAPSAMFDSVSVLEREVTRARVTGVFVSSAQELGHWRTEEGFTHLSARVPDALLHTRRDITAWQHSTKLVQDFRALTSYLAQCSRPALEKAVLMLKAGVLGRSGQFLAWGTWLLEVADLLDKRGSARNLVWTKVQSAPAGWCEPKSASIGALVKCVQEEWSEDRIIQYWNALVNPLKYQRPQEAPREGAVKAAEKLFEELGLAPALARRYASISDVQKWEWRAPEAAAPSTLGIFGGIRTREERTKSAARPALESGPITLLKFLRTALDGALEVTLRVPAYGEFTALTTAADPSAPPILKWDFPERRNPTGWYFYGSPSGAAQWGLGSAARVLGICKMPSAWGEGYPDGALGSGKAVLLLKGAMDGGSSGLGSALFPEILRAELHPVRSVMEAYSKIHDLQAPVGVPACGLAIGGGSVAKVDVRTTAGVITYTIDRLD